MLYGLCSEVKYLWINTQHTSLSLSEDGSNLSILSYLSSPALTAVLYDLSRQIPQLKKDIQDGLLKMLSLVLMHKPLRHPGMPKGLAHQLASPSLTNIPEASDVGSITLALRTLGSFEFEGKNLEKDTTFKTFWVLKQDFVLLQYMLRNTGR